MKWLGVVLLVLLVVYFIWQSINLAKDIKHNKDYKKQKELEKENCSLTCSDELKVDQPNNDLKSEK